MKRDYFSRLSFWARWYLPTEEAAEVLEDYSELIAQMPRREEDLGRDIGTPKDAIGQLVQLRAYQRWMTVFIVLAVCAVLPAADVVLTEVSEGLLRLFRIEIFLNGLSNSSRYAETLFPVGIVLSLVWFQRTGRKGMGKGLPKKIVPLFLLILLGMVWVWFLFWVILGTRMDVIDFLFPNRTWMVHLTISLNILVAGITAMTGLVKARLGDRRWRAIYVWGLTGVVLAVFLWKCLSCMSYSDEGIWQFPYWKRLVCVTMVGLVGTGASLC